MEDNDIRLEPHCAPCFNFLRGNVEEKKTVWLVPHAIKRRGGDTLITWRCNWEHVCEAGCIYSRAREGKEIEEV